MDIPEPYTRTVARTGTPGETVHVTAVGWGIEITRTVDDEPVSSTRWTRDDPALTVELAELRVLDVHPIDRDGRPTH